MNAATWPRRVQAESRLLHVDPGRGTVMHRRLADLPILLRHGDLLVVNDAATLPASLIGTTRGGAIEVRLAGGDPSTGEWDAVLFGGGSWRQRTEDRGTPPVLEVGDAIEFAEGLVARVQGISVRSSRLVRLRFDRDGARFWLALYRAGRPVQYSHLCGPLTLWHVQNLYGARPWAVEMPSAGRLLGVSTLRDLMRRGIGVASLTHAAGLSSTGDGIVDSLLPLPERFDIPAPTVEAIDRTRERHGRVVVVGTTVVRALEGCALQHGGILRAGTGRTDLRIGPGFVPRIVQGVLTGMHEPGTSHFELLAAFATFELLTEASRQAETAAYLAHEFGDGILVLESGDGA